MRTKEVFCNSSEFLRDPKFANAKLVHTYHYHCDNDPSRKNVESDNIRQTFELAKRAGKPIFHIRSLHSPVSKSSGLEKAFQGVFKDFLAFEGMPCMILSNMATQFGLYNGAICSFKGLLYLPDTVFIKLKVSEVLKLALRDKIVTHPVDLRGGNSMSRVHQLPRGSLLISMNKKIIESEDEIKVFLEGEDTILCEFQVPKTPPALPDFIVLESEEYFERRGPNIFRFSRSRKASSYTCQKSTEGWRS